MMNRRSADLSNRYRMTVEYLGGRYSGWQTQSGRPTIQQTLEATLSRLAKKAIRVHGAGRTDAGVHSLGQVAHFDFPPRPSIPDLRKALNAQLPPDIQVRSLKVVSPDFHAQKSAVRKRYEYRIYSGPVLSPALFGRACHVRQKLDFKTMEAAARLFEGRRDFSSFAAAGTRVRSRVRTVLCSRLRSRGRHATYRIEGDGFLQHMVRNIAGTLIEVGLGRRDIEELPAILEACDRKLAGPTAAPEGLWLIKVWY